MTIPKMSSQQFNGILEDTKNKINNMNYGIAAIKNNIDKKLLIIEHENQYLNLCLNNMSFKQEQDSTYVLLTDGHKGLYESYSNVVHAYLKKDPINIFNLKSINTNKSYFRDEVNVKINDVQNDEYINILKADDIEDKRIFFEEFPAVSTLELTDDSVAYLSENNDITLSIEVDKAKVIGVSKFNMIEIDPYLYKSFDIASIKIYGEDYENELYQISNIEKVGKTRIILDKKYEFKKVEFVFKPNYKTVKNDETIIPFGLKHIYFYEADFRNDSYMVIKYTSDEFIDSVKNKVNIVTPLGTTESTLTEQGIQIYLDNNNGSLESEQEPSENLKKPIARNLKTIYFRVPIKSPTQNDKNYIGSLIAFKFFIETR